MKNRKTAKKIIGAAVVLVVIPVALVLGVTLFNDRNYMLVSAFVALLYCVPFFIAFETNENTGRELVIIAVMCAISVVGRLIFAPVPGFKPVTAVVVIAGALLGAEVGFITGSMTALCSNVFFGQGPWTPFQMFAWGLIGLFAALLGELLKKNKIALAIFGALAGIFYSLVMDIWTVLWWEDFSFARYLAAVASSGIVLLIYAVSNVIFLLLLAKPIGEKLSRVIKKYGLLK